MRPDGKARRARIPGVFERGATQPAGMQRRPNANGFLIRDTKAECRGERVRAAEAASSEARTARLRAGAPNARSVRVGVGGSGAGRRGPRERPSRGVGRSPT